MGDSSRQKIRPCTSSHSSNNSPNTASSQNLRGFSPRANLEAQIAGALNDSVTAAKYFLDATAQKHASELLELQNSVQSQADLAKSFAETVEKLALNPNPRGLPDSAWPPLPGNGQLLSPQAGTGGPIHHRSMQGDPKVAQHVALASKQISLEYGWLDEGDEPFTKSVEAQRELLQRFNSWFDRKATPEPTKG
jgi:hypothetical protein